MVLLAEKGMATRHSDEQTIVHQPRKQVLKEKEYFKQREIQVRHSSGQVEGIGEVVKMRGARFRYPAVSRFYFRVVKSN